MLPISSLNGGIPRPQGAQPASLSATDAAEVRQQKPKTLPCKYCNKRFRRVEHVQRHERTHTKEKPFQCTWDRCGKTFGRRDLLVRHEKLVHLNDNNKDHSRPRKLSSTGPHQPPLVNGHGEGGSMGVIRPVRQQPLSPQAQPPTLSHPQHHQNLRPDKPSQHFHANHVASLSNGSASDVPCGPRSDACNLAMLSDAALASEVNQMQPALADPSLQPPAHDRPKSYSSSSGPYDERPREDSQAIASAYMPSPPQGSSDDYNLFLDDFAPTPHLLPPPYDFYQRTGSWSRLGTAMGHRGSGSRPSQLAGGANHGGQDSREQSDHSSRNEDARAMSLQISVVDHNTIKNRLDGFSTVLPSDFVFPSRHTLTRFLEGYISGFHEHLPFLHLPTLSPAEMAPELLLAILAVGAQHRFESNRGYALWYASKAVAMEQIRRRHSSEVHALLPTAAAYSPHSTRPSPNSTYRHSFASAQSERPLTQDTHREPYSSNTQQARLETMQAVLLLFAVGLWGAKTILHESLSMQSTLSVLVREDGLMNPDITQGTSNDWETWVRHEGATRTKLIAFCFFNLCSTAYNTPPLLLISELKLCCPQPSLLWRAETAWQWQELKQTHPGTDASVHEAFARLFSRSSNVLPLQMSSLGNYVLIHALLQHIYLLKQTSFAAGSPYDVHRTLKPEDAEDVAQALQMWQTSFEQRHQVRVTEPGHLNGTDSVPGGSLAYNASALFRLAYIRIYTELPPNVGLDSRDPLLVASALSHTPLLVRSLRLHRAVFQAVHALSVLVKAGVKYVVHTKSPEWSIQHSLCNFECAILVAKWLLTLSSISRADPPVSPEERSLLDTVQRMLDETEFAVPIDPSLSGPGLGQSESSASEVTKLRRLASAVIRLWAETFKGSHIFDIVKVMGSSLDGYSDIIDKPRPRTTSAGRLPNMV